MERIKKVCGYHTKVRAGYHHVKVNEENKTAVTPVCKNTSLKIHYRNTIDYY